jgi:two-component system cell cycle response regulator DivK
MTGREARPRRQRRLVLLVDDCADTRSLYAEYLDLAGFDVKEAGDGLAAVTAATSALPDVVVMDLSLPGLGGREAAARIKADPRTSGTPVIVVSGFSADAVDTGGEVAPWDEFVVKPCIPEDLVDIIGRLLGSA